MIKPLFAAVMKIYCLVIFLFTSNSLWGQSKFTFVFLNKRVDKEELPKDQLDKLMEGHMANMDRLAKEDKLIAAGPFEGSGGILFLSRIQLIRLMSGYLQILESRLSDGILKYFRISR